MYILSELLEGVVFIDRAPLFVGYSAYHLMIYESNLYTSDISIYILYLTLLWVPGNHYI